LDTPLWADFAAAISGPDHAVDLFGGAMLIASIGGHEPDPHAVARQLDLIAEDVRVGLPDSSPAGVIAQAIDHELFTVRGFSGNAEAYDDPRNSYLDQVLERRIGIPITLSLVYMEVAQRVGLRCDGIGYPGHFIVRCGDPEAGLFVDPFNQGARLDHTELLAGLRGQQLSASSPESYLAALTRRQILQRMLHNLRGSYRSRRDHLRWLDTVHLLLAIEPWNAALVGERGMLYYRLGRPEHALDDLERYVGACDTRETAAPAAVRLLDELRLKLGPAGAGMEGVS
jgi:regulator of sirC expression with transglutaminase-like and TPR domain